MWDCVASHSLSCLTYLALSELILKITYQINHIIFPRQDPILHSKDAEPRWPEGRQIWQKHRVWWGGHSDSLGAASSLVSRVTGLQEPWEEATGRDSFPMCLRLRREAVTFGKMPSLCPASVLGAAARLIPSCSATRLLVLVGLEQSHVQGSHWAELRGVVMVVHPVCGSGSKASCPSSSIIQFPQFSFTGPIQRHIGTAQSLDT